jgi:hypothetical protein
MSTKTAKDIESIGTMYDHTIIRLQAEISKALLASNWQAAKLLQTAMSILKQGQREIIEVVGRNGVAQYQEQLEAKFEELKAAGFDFDEVSKVLGEADVAAVLNAEDQVRRFFAQTVEPTRKLIQGITVKVRQKAAEEGWSSGKAFRALRDEVMSQHLDFTFVDRAGRKWAPEKYLRMVSRTLMAESQREAHEAAYAEAGVDLVKVSIHGTKCEKCQPYEGMVLSLTGATEGYPTVAKARREGLFHPNCKHRLLAHVA